VESRRDGVDPGHWISRLQKLSSQLQSTRGKGNFVSTGRTGYPSQLYGIWLRDYEDAEECVWRAYFRASVLEGIELLEDDDPNNDQFGYFALAQTLLRAGDVDNGLASLSIVLQPLVRAREQEQEQAQAQRANIESRDQESPNPTTSEDDPPCESFISKVEMDLYPSYSANTLDLNLGKDSDLMDKYNSESSPINPPKADISSFVYGVCDGPCSTLNLKYQEMHFCLICYDTSFCEKCILLVRPDNFGDNSNSAEHPNPVSGSRLPYWQCSPNHSWVQGYPLPVIPGKTDIAATVKDGYVEVRQGWLTRLREQWKD
jgi:hypothetical protein